MKEYDSSNQGKRSNLPIGDMIRLPIDIEQPKETKIYRCYDRNKKLIGEVRPFGISKILEIQFQENVKN